MMTPLVGFIGLRGSGKTKACNYLEVAFRYRLISFKAVLVDMIRALGLKEDKISGHLKEEPCDLLCGKTPRYALQTIGTEWGRDLIGKDIWVRAWEAKVAQAVADKEWVCVDDCRFENEATAIRAHGGIIVKILRPMPLYSGGEAGQHSSETEGLGIKPDLIIENTGTKEDLREKVRDIIFSGTNED